MAMMSFPVFLSASLSIFKKFGYQGDLRIVLVILGLNIISLIVLYRLQISSPWKVASLLNYTSPVPAALKQLVYSIVGLLLMTVLATHRGTHRVLTALESCKMLTPLSGILSFVFLLMAKMTGLKDVFMASEIAFKGFFLVFLASFFTNISSRFSIKQYPVRDHLKWIMILLLGIGIYFIIPLLIYGERGSGFLMLIIIFLLVAHFTKKCRFFMVGLVLLVSLLAIGCIVSPSLRERAFGAWIFYNNYINAPYLPGKDTTPGRQLFNALASIRVTPFGLGISRGVLTFKLEGKTRSVVPAASHDFISIPIAMEFGIAAIFIICGSYILLFWLISTQNNKFTFRDTLAICIAASLACQGMYNIAGSIGLTIMTGIPAPWLSFSGTAMLANYILAAIPLSVLNEKEDTTSDAH